MNSIWTNVASAAVFSGLGVVLFLAAFFILDLLTPGKLWDEIGEKRNQAAATLMGCVAIVPPVAKPEQC